MSRPAEPTAPKAVYRVEGLSCANCAKTFESNVRRIPGVIDAAVNFAAATLTVYGEASVEALEEAGKFERLTIVPERPPGGSVRAAGRPEQAGAPFLKKHAGLAAAGLLTMAGFAAMAWEALRLPAPLLFAAAMLAGGRSLFKTGLMNLLRLRFDIRTLMTVALIGAAAIGEWAEGAVVVLLFAASEALERFSMERARRSIRSLMDLAPKEALVRRDGREAVVPADDLAVGDIVIVKPGQTIAGDGVVARGSGSVNQAAVTGESIPVWKTEGDDVFAGTMNMDGLLEVRVTRKAEHSAIARIIHLVEEAQASRAPAQAFVDAFAKFYTPAIIALAVLVAVVPPLALDAEWTRWIYLGLSVLVVGCPCALVISTPVSIVSAIGSAARHGVLVKGGLHLEQLGAVRSVAFDKTGTLTRGMPDVTDYAVLDDGIDKNALFAVIAALERRASHPLASAIVRKAERDGLDFETLQVEQFRSVDGRGVRGAIRGTEFFVGSLAWLADMQHPGLTEERLAMAQALQREGKTVVAAATERDVLAFVAAKDELRESAASAVGDLGKLGIRHTVLLTGDNRIAAEAIRKEAGISEAQADLLPDAKWQAVQALKVRYGSVAMVGDGINDAPALAAATVGVAMGGTGTDVALETADIVLMGDDLARLPFAIRLSRKTLAVIKQNIAFSLAVKLAALLLVIPGWLTLWIAVASDMGATLVVTLNALRLMRAEAKAAQAAPAARR